VFPWIAPRNRALCASNPDTRAAMQYHSLELSQTKQRRMKQFRAFRHLI
jgi:hypothetical protein